jgi:hypothetical protein
VSECHPGLESLHKKGQRARQRPRPMAHTRRRSAWTGTRVTSAMAARSRPEWRPKGAGSLTGAAQRLLSDELDRRAVSASAASNGHGRNGGPDESALLSERQAVPVVVVRLARRSDAA